MLQRYIKKYYWVILTLLLVIGIIAAVFLFFMPNQPPHEFQGIFILTCFETEAFP